MATSSKLLSIVTALALAGAGDAAAQTTPPAAGGSTPPTAVPAKAGGRVLPAPTRNYGFLMRMNFDFGGDELMEVEWDDGDETTLKAGQLITFAAGVLYRQPEAPWAVEATLGYKFDQANADNATIKFTRIPLDLVASFAHGGHRIGAGPTVHLSPAFSCEADGICDGELEYDNAFGGILQYAYGLRMSANAGLDLGLRYTFIEYSGDALPDLDGSGVGFFFGGWF